jgi:hypothetical protein
MWLYVEAGMQVDDSLQKGQATVCGNGLGREDPKVVSFGGATQQRMQMDLQGWVA